jgi:hypothetical protein
VIGAAIKIATGEIEDERDKAVPRRNLVVILEQSAPAAAYVRL